MCLPLKLLQFLPPVVTTIGDIYAELGPDRSRTEKSARL